MPNPVVIIPTYNNAKTLKRVVDGVMDYTQSIIIINDGSTDGTTSILENYSKLELISKSQNEGKGKALLTGFKKAIELGYDHAITIDSDGQHFPEDLPKFFELIEKEPNSMILGARNMDQEGIPGKSSFGHKFSNFWFWVETGLKVPDTQTGFRCYPLNHMKGKKYFTTKYELEIEIIVRLAWKYVPFRSIPVKVLYDADERVSHFRPFMDFTRISILNTVLVTLMLLWHLHIRIIRTVWKKGLWNIIKAEAIKPEESTWSKALSIGFGFFMSSFPVWGFQMLIAGGVATGLKLNRVLVLTASNISFAPFVPFIIFASYLMGKPFVEAPLDIDFSQEIKLADIHQHFMQYFIGSIVLSTSLFIVGTLLSFPIIKLIRKK